MGVAFMKNGRGSKKFSCPPHFLRAGAASDGFCIGQFERTDFRILSSSWMMYFSDILRRILHLAKTLQRIFGSFLSVPCR